MNRTFAFIAVFVASAAVLVLEIVAGRILAPYVGVSLQTFTGIIGTILAAIALGAWLGGRAADNNDPSKLLGPVLIVGGVLAVVSPALVAIAGPTAAGESPLAIVFLAAVGFFLPAAVLSAVTPIVAKALLGSLDETGSVVGQLSAIGTAGALFGTFITGFFLIAAMPSQPITWVVGAVLVVLGGFHTLRIGQRMIVSGLVILALSIVGSAAMAAPCDYETTYSCAVIAERSDDESVKALVLDTFVNSVVDVDDPTYLGSRYARTIDAVVSSRGEGEAQDFVYIGGAGMTLPRYYYATSGASAVVLELDPVLPDIAESELGLDAGPWLDVRIGDARMTLRGLDEQGFDVAVGDAFSGRSVPWHLTTAEFMEDIATVLRPGGLYVMNVIDHAPFGFVKAETATLLEVFDHVAVVAPQWFLDGERGGNFVLAGSSEPIDPAAVVPYLRDDESVIVADEVISWIGGAAALTDAYAPVDQLLSSP